MQTRFNAFDPPNPTVCAQRKAPHPRELEVAQTTYSIMYEFKDKTESTEKWYAVILHCNTSIL